MHMTTNTIWTPISSENLPALANWTEFDTQLLTELGPHAAAAAPAFREAIFSRLTQNFLYVSPIEYELGKSALEKWFIHLFHNAETIKTLHPCRENQAVGFKAQLHRKSGIPFRYMLSLQEVILKYGKRVTQNSYEPEQAYSAFQKILGLEFALDQVYEEMYISHLSELMMDD
jgi:hypothetical protein